MQKHAADHPLAPFTFIQMWAQEGEVYILPTIRINEGQYRG